MLISLSLWCHWPAVQVWLWWHSALQAHFIPSRLCPAAVGHWCNPTLCEYMPVKLIQT